MRTDRAPAAMVVVAGFAFPMFVVKLAAARRLEIWIRRRRMLAGAGANDP